MKALKRIKHNPKSGSNHDKKNKNKTKKSESEGHTEKESEIHGNSLLGVGNSVNCKKELILGFILQFSSLFFLLLMRITQTLVEFVLWKTGEKNQENREREGKLVE